MSKRTKTSLKQKVPLPAEGPAAASVEVPVERDRAVSFPIVGIGASAGGLAAIEAFFAAMPPDTQSGMAFVLVQHLAPDHKSILLDLVKRYTRMQVYKVEDGMEVQPNCIYIIPPNRDMAFLDGKLHLLEPAAPRGCDCRLIFSFVPWRRTRTSGRSVSCSRALAPTALWVSKRSRRRRDGHGAGPRVGRVRRHAAQRHRHRSGGLCSAAGQNAGATDRLRRSTPLVGHHGRPSPPAPKAGDALQKVSSSCCAPRPATTFLTTSKTPSTAGSSGAWPSHQIDHLDDYVRYLQENSLEVETLFRELLIGVTNFFRDPEALEALKEHVIPRLLAGKPPGRPVRVWVPGCSTGEEAYSLAIVLKEMPTI